MLTSEVWLFSMHCLQFCFIYNPTEVEMRIKMSLCDRVYKAEARVYFMDLKCIYTLWKSAAPRVRVFKVRCDICSLLFTLSLKRWHSNISVAWHLTPPSRNEVPNKSLNQNGSDCWKMLGTLLASFYLLVFKLLSNLPGLSEKDLETNERFLRPSYFIHFIGDLSWINFYYFRSSIHISSSKVFAKIVLLND